MATQGVVTVTMVPVSAAVAQRRFVEIDASGNVQQVGTSGNNAIGVSAQASEANLQQAIPVAIFNGAIMEVEAGAAVARGADVMANATGKAITAATTGSDILGIALTAAAADGEFVEVLLSKAAREV